MRRIYVDNFLIKVLLIVHLCGCDCQKGKDVGNGLGFISSVKNSVYYKSYNSLVWIKAREKLPVYSGDYVRTGEKSFAIIQFEKERLVLQENTLIKIEKGLVGNENSLPIEVVVLDGEIYVEEGGDISKNLILKRSSDDKLKFSDVGSSLESVEYGNSKSDVFYEKELVTRLLYPCNNEKIGINNPVFRWNGKISGLLRIYKDKKEFDVIYLNNEDSRQLYLPNGLYEWDIAQNDKSISNRCAFEIITSEGVSGKVIPHKRQMRNINLKLAQKEDDIPEVMGQKRRVDKEKSDIVKSRLVAIQKIIDESIEQINKTRKGINPEKIKDYAQIYNKLDELSQLLRELKRVQESLLLEVIRLGNPKVIAKCLSELDDIESNLKEIDKEIKEIEAQLLSNSLNP